MSKDDREFEAWMAQMDVRRLLGDDAKQGIPAASDRRVAAPSDTAGMDEFEEALRTMMEVPDKDTPIPIKKTRESPERVDLVARKRVQIAATLDLHGCTEPEALKSLDRFIRHCTEDRLSSVLIITGQGLHSRGGVSVLRPAIERRLSSHGAVRAYGRAPRAYGGPGALVVWLEAP